DFAAAVDFGRHLGPRELLRRNEWQAASIWHRAYRQHASARRIKDVASSLGRGDVVVFRQPGEDFPSVLLQLGVAVFEMPLDDFQGTASGFAAAASGGVFQMRQSGSTGFGQNFGSGLSLGEDIVF